MALPPAAFVPEVRDLVERKHSRNHPIIGKIERGELDGEALRGFVKQFYLFFPKPFPKPIAAMYARCPDDPELERITMDFFLARTMEDAGLVYDALNVTYMAYPDGVKALASKAIDGFWAPEPWGAMAETQGVGVRFVLPLETMVDTSFFP